MTNRAGTQLVALDPGVGEPLWWTGTLATLKATGAETEGQFTLVEILAPPNLVVPRHVHHNEDEAFWVLEGDGTFEIDGQAVHAFPGAFLLGPRGLPHSYVVGAAGIRMLFLFTPAGFEGFIRETGKTAPSRTAPPLPGGPPSELELAELAAVGAGYGIELVR